MNNKINIYSCLILIPIIKIWETGNFDLSGVCPSNVLDKVIQFIKNNLLCIALLNIDLVGVDFPERTDKRFTVVYILRSVHFNTCFYLYTQINEQTMLPSIVPQFNNLAWSEREVWDLFGIIFSNHQNLTRLLTDYGFNGHPLRKDFPISGYNEINWNKRYIKLQYTPTQLTQEYRHQGLYEIYVLVYMYYLFTIVFLASLPRWVLSLIIIADESDINNWRLLHLNILGFLLIMGSVYLPFYTYYAYRIYNTTSTTGITIVKCYLRTIENIRVPVYLQIIFIVIYLTVVCYTLLRFNFSTELFIDFSFLDELPNYGNYMLPQSTFFAGFYFIGGPLMVLCGTYTLWNNQGIRDFCKYCKDLYNNRRP
jgi:NADH-quinone oxidoreductase subunit C